MKSIGETLREAREAKGATIKQISQDSNISREYLTGLEEENFDIFPAETYVLGFLRNYSEYLGLDSEKSVALYKNYKISEEPAPLEELVGQTNHHRVPLRLVFIVFLLAVLAIGVGLFAYKSFMKDRPAVEETVPVRDTVQYRLDESEAQWNLLTDDEILISYENGELHMTVVLDGNKLYIRPVGGGSELVFSAGDEKILPGGEGIPVIGFRLSSIDESGALLSVHRTDVAVVREPVEIQSDVVPAAQAGRKASNKILLQNRNVPENFTLNALFSGYCLFRYQADNGEVVEKFYRDGDRIRLDVSESLLIGLSSGAAVTIKISGVNVVPGKSGEVAVKFIQWVKNDEGKYNLVLFPVQ
jgi:cytoskeleton protein RodZ